MSALTRACILVVFLAFTGTAYGQGSRTGAANSSIRDRALVAMNAFEVWAFTYYPEETVTPSGHIRCEPLPGSPPHACQAGTLPICLACVLFTPGPDTSLMRRREFLASEQLMLATLDSAAAALPSDELLVGTLVFMLTRRGLLEDARRVASAPRCMVSESTCQLFGAYVHQASGNTLRASASFDSAFARLPEGERCSLIDAWAALDEADRVTYVRLPCTARAAHDSAFWWLSDPSYLVPGNDRLTEHLARAVGNRILERYRAARVSVGVVNWWAGAVPRADSADRFFDFAKWVQHPAGPWRWYNELTRFGMNNAIEIIPGTKKRGTRFRHDFPGSSAYVLGAPIDQCIYRGQMCFPRTPESFCRMGYEPRELSIPDVFTTGLRRVPLHGEPDKALYPVYTFFKYDWSEMGAASCARMYNTGARYEFTPIWRATTNPFGMASDSWQLDDGDEFVGGPPHREQYTPRYAPVTTISQYQIARLPRGDSMLVVAVMHTSPDDLDVGRDRGAAKKWEAALLATSNVPPRSPDDMIVVRSHSETFQPRQVLTAMLPTTSIFTALEVLTPDTVGYARMRTGIPISPWLEGAAKLSDIVFFRPDTSSRSGSAISESSLESIMPLALPSLTVTRGQQLGLYWETQVAALAATTTDASVTLTVERINQEPGFIGRVLGGIFGGRSEGPRSVVWQMPVPGAGVGAAVRWGNALNITTNTLDPGDYVLTIEVRGISATAPITRRSLTVVRARR